jgi:hypothetical protein
VSKGVETIFLALTIQSGVVGFVGRKVCPPHGASPNGDGTEFRSVKALYLLNTKEHDRRKIMTYRG